MASKLSFAIAINLLTENFKKGTNQVKAGFRAMQMQVLTFAAALGAGGLGLTNFVSRLIDVARETNRVTTALKNVSGSMGQYANNQRYLLDIAKKYGLEINALTGNFAKFTAAASISGMSMMEQRKIFESVSRACTAFGMSADDSNGVFLALSQMMSKGKISSEELRLQMGERLPVAIQAMAKAAGVSVGQLDKLLKQGKLLSADVLPKFGKALDELIPNVDTDNLETSMNRLKNVFTEFTNGTGVQNRFKALVDGVTKLVQYGANNIKSIITYTIAALLVLITSKFVNKVIGAIAKAGLAAKAEARSAAKAAGLAFDETAWKAQKASASMRMAFSKAAASVKAVMVSMIPTAIITGIGYIIAKLINLGREAKRIKNIFSDYQKSMSVAGNTQEVTRMETLLKIMNDRKKSQKEINAAQTELQGMLGKEKLSQEELNKRILKRISLLKEAAMADAAFNTVGEFTEKNAKLGVGLDLSPEQMERLARLNPGKNQGYDNRKYYYDAIRKEAGQLSKGGRYVLDESKLRQIDKAVDEYVQNLRVINDATARAGEHQANTGGIIPPLEPDDDKKKTPLQKQQESYDKQLSELKAELEIGSKTQAEYNKALGELNIKMFAQAKGTNDKKVLESEYYKNLKIAAEKAVQDQDKNAALVELEKVQKDYCNKLDSLNSQVDKGALSQKEFNTQVANLALESAKSAAGIKGVGNVADGFITNMLFNAKMLSVGPKKGKYDSTYDYKKTDVEIFSGKLDVAKKWKDDLKDAVDKGAAYLQSELDIALSNVTSLEEALKVATVKKDVEDLKKSLSEGVYSGVKDIASSADRVVSAFESLDDVMNDVDASGWEKIMAIWNAMFNAIDSFLSIAKAIEDITKLTNKLTKAKEAETLIDSASTNTKIANRAAETTAEITALSAQTTAEVTASSAKSTAASTEMAAKSTAAYAYIPFAGVGLAATQIASMEALIAAASIPRFASGGIYMGGTISGDKGLARLNKGELVLNMSQQSKLFNFINSGNMSAHNHITVGFEGFKVRGDVMELAINNSRKSKGKRPL